MIAFFVETNFEYRTSNDECRNDEEILPLRHLVH